MYILLEFAPLIELFILILFLPIYATNIPILIDYLAVLFQKMILCRRASSKIAKATQRDDQSVKKKKKKIFGFFWCDLALAKVSFDSVFYVWSPLRSFSI